MALHTYNSNFSFGPDCFPGLYDPFACGSNGFNAFSCGGAMITQSQSLVLDAEKGELVKAPAAAAKKSVTPEKAMAALKSHSEAERRRRERINSHLATLRRLVPCTDKMDKASLLAEVISQVKELKKTAVEASRGLLIPMDADEVTVEPCEDESGDDVFSFRASICCEFQPNLLSDVRQALESLPLKLVKAEISTVGGRLKNVFVFTRQENGSSSGDTQTGQQLIDSVRQALRTVLEKTFATPEYLPWSANPNKRRKVSSSDSSSSCSS